jgi:UDP-glucose 4-epimerase
MPTLAKSPYAAQKVAAESMLRAYSGSYGLDTVSLRYFNIFGPRQNANSAYAAVIAAFAKALIAGNRPVIFGDGEQSRDFTYVANAVHANLLALRKPEPLAGEVINVACGQRVDVNELAALCLKILNRPDLTPEHREERAGDVKHSLADMTKAKQLLNYTPIVTFQAGLVPTLRWYEQVLRR